MPGGGSLAPREASCHVVAAQPRSPEVEELTQEPMRTEAAQSPVSELGSGSTPSQTLRCVQPLPTPRLQPPERPSARGTQPSYT